MRTGRSLTVCRSLLGGGGGIQACTEADPPCEQNDKQVQKIYLGHDFVAVGKKVGGREWLYNFMFLGLPYKVSMSATERIALHKIRVNVVLKR